MPELVTVLYFMLWIIVYEVLVLSTQTLQEKHTYTECSKIQKKKEMKINKYRLKKTNRKLNQTHGNGDMIRDFQRQNIQFEWHW